MEIYFDESGSFVPGTDQISCMGALAIPSAAKQDVFKEFLAIKKAWGVDGEIKGSNLSEEQMAEVIALLSKSNALFDACSTLLIDTPLSAIRQVQRDAAFALMGNLSSQHDDVTHLKWHKLSSTMLTLSIPHFEQYQMGVTLTRRILQFVLYYAAEKYPHELGDIKWKFDTKNNNPFHGLYKELISPVISVLDEEEPTNRRISVDPNFDYSWFYRRYGAGDPPDESGKSGFRLEAVLAGNLHFGDSAQHPGLQLVDIATSAFSRAVNGNLKEPGWAGLGSLMWKQEAQTVLLKIPTPPDIIKSAAWDKITGRYNEVNKILNSTGIEREVGPLQI